MNAAAARAPIAYVTELATRFDANFRPDGWGQFLDSSVKQLHVGLYGTSVGSIIMALDGRTQTTRAQKVLDTLLAYLTENTDRIRTAKAQTLRMAMLYLGISFLTKGSPPAELRTLLAHMLQRRIPGKAMWGDYWLDAANYDENPRLFVTAVVLVSLTLPCKSGNSHPELKNSGLALQRTYLDDPTSHKSYADAIYAALALTLGKDVDTAVRSEMRRAANANIVLGRRYIHFYDYVDAQSIPKRDYFILPIELLAPLALYGQGVPAIYQLRASVVVRQLQANLDNNSGCYVTTRGGRISTLEQGFAALALDAMREYGVSEQMRLLTRLTYAVFKQRTEHERLFCWAMVVAYLTVGATLAAQYFLAHTPLVPNWLQASALVVLGAIKNPKDMLRTILPSAK